MVQYCCVPNCSNYALKKNISMHLIPLDEHLRREWIVKIRRDDSQSAAISKHMRVCSAHFKPSDYTQNPRSKCKKLIKGAVPSIFNFESKKKERKKPSPRALPDIVDEESTCSVTFPCEPLDSSSSAEDSMINSFGDYTKSRINFQQNNGNLTRIVRSAEDVKRKWNDLKSRVKNKADDIREGKISDKTPLSHLEERVLYLIAKTSHLQGLNGALPPAYLNVIDQKKQDKIACSSSEPFQSEDIAESNTVVEENTETDDIITIKQEIPEVLNPHPTMPAVTTIPIITFTAPFSQIIQTSTEARIISNLGDVESNSRKNTKGVSNDSEQNSESVGNDSKQKSESVGNNSRLNDTREVTEMIYSSQKELKNELKTIKKIMIRISDQKRKRIAQEDEKIQLKKLKLMLKCQKHGVDYEEFITEFL